MSPRTARERKALDRLTHAATEVASILPLNPALDLLREPMTPQLAASLGGLLSAHEERQRARSETSASKSKRPPRRSKKTAKERKATLAVYEAVAMRAGMAPGEAGWFGGFCECCGLPFWPYSLVARPEMDHAHGRKNAPESDENCWMLRADCHRAKHRGDPLEWLAAYGRHSKKHGNREELRWVEQQIAWFSAKSSRLSRESEAGR